MYDRIHDHKINRLDDLLTWNWMPPKPPLPDFARRFKAGGYRLALNGYLRGLCFA